MTFTQAQVIYELANNNMSVQATAKTLYRSNSGTWHIIKAIERETGLNPRCFHHLCELLPEAMKVLEGGDDGDS